MITKIRENLLTIDEFEILPHYVDVLDVLIRPMQQFEAEETKHEWGISCVLHIVSGLQTSLRHIRLKLSAQSPVVLHNINPCLKSIASFLEEFQKTPAFVVTAALHPSREVTLDGPPAAVLQEAWSVHKSRHRSSSDVRKTGVTRSFAEHGSEEKDQLAKWLSENTVDRRTYFNYWCSMIGQCESLATMALGYMSRASVSGFYKRAPLDGFMSIPSG